MPKMQKKKKMIKSREQKVLEIYVHTSFLQLPDKNTTLHTGPVNNNWGVKRIPFLYSQHIFRLEY